MQHHGVAYDNLVSIAALPDGSYALAGYQARVPTGQTRLDFNGWWIRLDAQDGSMLHSRTFGIGPDNETFRSVAPTPDGGLLLGGSNFPNVYAGPAAVEQGLLLKVDSLDTEQWRQVIVAPVSLGQYGCTISQVLPLPQPGAFVVAGQRVVPLANPLGRGAARYDTYYIARYQATGNGAADWQLFPGPAGPGAPASRCAGPGGAPVPLANRRPPGRGRPVHGRTAAGPLRAAPEHGARPIGPTPDIKLVMNDIL